MGRQREGDSRLEAARNREGGADLAGGGGGTK